MFGSRDSTSVSAFSLIVRLFCRLKLTVTFTPDGCPQQRPYCRRGPVFPEKLWEAVNADRGLLAWSADGRSIVVEDNDEKFRLLVDRMYPDLVDIPTFANFRRQLREYGFAWTYNSETLEFDFTHPCFARGRPDLLHGVLTRRGCYRRDHNGRTMRRRGAAGRQAKRVMRLSTSTCSLSLSCRSDRASTPASSLDGEWLCKWRQASTNVRVARRKRQRTKFDDFVQQAIGMDKTMKPAVRMPGLLRPFGRKSERSDLLEFCRQDALMAGEQNSADEEEWWTYCLPWICKEIAEADGMSSDAERDDILAHVYRSDDSGIDIDNSAISRTVYNLPLPPGQVLRFLSASGGMWISREFSSFDEM